MAPDISGLSNGGTVDYSTPGSGGYNVPDVTLNVGAIVISTHLLDWSNEFN